MSQYTKIPESEQENVLSMFWVLLRRLENRANTSKNIFDISDVQAGYRLWNRITGDRHKAAWEE